MNTAYYTQDYMDDDGNKFRIEYFYDEHCDPPWDNSDLHGEVSDWERRKKKPGELILIEDRHGHKRFYDFQGAVTRARDENWGNWQQGETPDEKGELLNAAVMSDYHFLRGWCNDDWHYMGIVAFPLTDERDELRSQSQSLWGIESCSDSAWIQECVESVLLEAGANGQVTEWDE